MKDRQGKKIGEIEDIVLDKQSNNIMFAVVSFGGFLRMGEKYHPLPWTTLDYDKDAEGYVVDVTEDQLRSAPTGSIDELTRNDGSGYRDGPTSTTKSLRIGIKQMRLSMRVLRIDDPNPRAHAGLG